MNGLIWAETVIRMIGFVVIATGYLAVVVQVVRRVEC